jgi:hypothetical protein
VLNSGYHRYPNPPIRLAFIIFVLIITYA